MTEPAGNTYELGELGQRVMRAWLDNAVEAR
jgi:hypothetical protein